jgi:hypothetical protein
MEEKRADAELLIKKVLQEKSFLVLTQEDKSLIIDVYDDEMRIESTNYEEYLLLDESEKLNNILVLVLKDYLGSWHVSTEEMKEISDYIQSISKS